VEAISARKIVRALAEESLKERLLYRCIHHTCI